MVTQFYTLLLCSLGNVNYGGEEAKRGGMAMIVSYHEGWCIGCRTMTPVPWSPRSPSPLLLVLMPPPFPLQIFKKRKVIEWDGYSYSYLTKAAFKYVSINVMTAIFFLTSI